MRVSLFFDGKNFYENLERAYSGQHHLDYQKLAAWLVERVAGTQLTGAHYYTGIPDRLDPSLPEYPQLRGLMRFLDSLEYVEGFFVYRFPRIRRMHRCPTCAAENSYTEEKEVDTTMVADMIRLAADDAFDVMVLCSGDADHAPAAEAIRSMGKVVYLASWGDEALSPRLRRAAFGHIDLLTECPEEILDDPLRAAARIEVSGGDAESGSNEEFDPELLHNAAQEVARAQQYFEEHGGFLGRGYFIHRWRGREIPGDADQRELILDHLVENTLVEEIQILGETALRIPQTGSDPTLRLWGIGDGPKRKKRNSPSVNGATPVFDTVIPRETPPKTLPDWVQDVVEAQVVENEDLRAAWQSLRRAEMHFQSRGFVGRGYFLTRWRDSGFSDDVAFRERLLTQLIEIGVVEQYDVDSTTALRSTRSPTPKAS